MTDTNHLNVNEMTDAERVVARLRDLADFFERCPSVASTGYWLADHTNLFLSKERWQEALREVGTFEKGSDSSYLEARVRLPHGGKVTLNVSKTETCERIQVGVKTVTKEVYPDDVQPTLVEVEEPQYDWVCPDSWLNS